jgi:hypothetical protein
MKGENRTRCWRGWGGGGWEVDGDRMSRLTLTDACLFRLVTVHSVPPVAKDFHIEKFSEERSSLFTEAPPFTHMGNYPPVQEK